MGVLSMNIRVIFSIIMFLTFSGCSTIGDIKDWAFDDKDEEIETVYYR
jgi:hypothetical protein